MLLQFFIFIYSLNAKSWKVNPIMTVYARKMAGWSVFYCFSSFFHHFLLFASFPIGFHHLSIIFDCFASFSIVFHHCCIIFYCFASFSAVFQQFFSIIFDCFSGRRRSKSTSRPPRWALFWEFLDVSMMFQSDDVSIGWCFNRTRSLIDFSTLI